MLEFLKDKEYRKQFFIAIGFGFFALLVIASRAAKGIGRVDSIAIFIFFTIVVLGLIITTCAFGHNYKESLNKRNSRKR